MAIISLRLRGADQTEIEVDVILDTGFTEALALSSDLIATLGWRRRDTMQIILADGTMPWISVYEGRVWWNGEWKRLLAEATDGMPLLGMALIDGTLITLEAVVGGEVTVEPLE
jgi:clan AA aspartic protease